MLKHRWSWLIVIALACVVASPAWGQDEDPAGAEEPVAEEPVATDPQSAITAMLQRMDVDLPRLLSAADFEILRARCDVQRAPWAACVTQHGGDADQCAELEQALARCVVESDDVVSLYLSIASEKKRIFGKELYVEFAGLLAALPIEALAEARQACPQAEVGAAAECLMNHDVVGGAIKVYYDLARAIVEQAAHEAGAEGNEIDVDVYTDQVAQLLLTLPSGTILALAKQCMKLYPELEKTRSAEDIDRSLECIAEQGKTDPVANPAYISKDKLLSWLDVARTKVIAQIRGKETSKQDENFRRVLLGILGLIAGGYLLVLLSPIVLRMRYPAAGSSLWKASSIAAGTFATTIAMLGVSLLLIRGIQGSVAADSTSPKMRVADAAFAVLAKSDTAAAISDLSKERLDFIKSPLRNIVDDVDGADAERYAVFAAYLANHWADMLDEPELKNIAKNVTTLKSHGDSMKSVFGVYKKIDWLMGIIPILMSLLAIALYLLPLKDMLVEIITAPARAAASPGAADQASKRAMMAVKSELKSIVPFLLMIMILLPVTGFFLALAMEPLVEMLIGYSLLTLFYILFTEASPFVIYTSLGCAMVLLVMCLGAYMTAMGTVLGQTRKIFRAIFLLGYRFADFKRFWVWSGAAAFVMLALPFAYAYGAIAVARIAQSDDGSFGAKDLLLVPVPALLLFPVMFWAARGWKALQFIKKYPVPTTPPPDSARQP